MANSTARKPQRRMEKPAATVVPKIRIYIERPEEPEHWLVSVRHVADRGAWHAEPHAHPHHGQVIYVRSGRGVMNLEGSSVPFEGPCVLLLPTECVHGLDYEVDADRWVMTMEMSYLSQVNKRLREFIQLWSQARVIRLDGAAAVAECDSLISKLEHEVRSNPVGHVVATEALLTVLLLTLVRASQALEPDGAGELPREAGSRNEVRLVERFRELVELHYPESLALQDYASRLAVSVVQLRAACTAVSGQSPTKMIHARLITEAKRHLIFGDLSVEQIAFALGFADAAYFTRFFRKEVGQVPSQFRAGARQHSQHD